MSVTPDTLMQDFDVLAEKAALKWETKVIVEKDVILRCHGEALRQIPFFQSCFQFNSNDGKVDLSESGLTFVGVAHNLRFIYISEFLNPEYAQSRLIDSLTASNFQEILEAANFFQIRRVLDLSCSFIRSNLDRSNIFDVLQLSLDLNLTRLRLFCLDYIGFHFKTLFIKAVPSSPTAVSSECLGSILSHSNMLIDSEDDVYKVVQRWSSRFPKVWSHLRSNLCSPAVRASLDVSLCDTTNRVERSWPRLLIASFNDCPHARYLGKSDQEINSERPESDDDDRREDEENYEMFKSLKDFKTRHILQNVIRSYDPANKRWSKIDFANFNGDCHGFLLLGSGRYMIGIKRSDTCEDCSAPAPMKRAVQSIWRLDIEDNEWNKICNFREELIGPMKIVYLNNVVYIIGIDSDLDIVQRKYDLNSSEPEGRSFGDNQVTPELFYNSIFITDNRDTLYLIECNDTNSSIQILSLNVAQDDGKWKMKREVGIVYKDSAVVFESPDKAFVSGGRNPTSSRRLHSWNVNDNTWTKLTCMESNRFAHGSCILPGVGLVVIGGRGFYQREISTSIEFYDDSENVWNTVKTSKSFASNYYPNNAFTIFKPLRLMYQEDYMK